MDITKTLATISSMRTKAIFQNKDKAVALLDELAVVAVAISKLDEGVNSVDYEERQKLIESFKEILEKIPNNYKPYGRKSVS